MHITSAMTASLRTFASPQEQRHPNTFCTTTRT